MCFGDCIWVLSKFNGLVYYYLIDGRGNMSWERVCTARPPLYCYGEIMSVENYVDGKGWLVGLYVWVTFEFVLFYER